MKDHDDPSLSFWYSDPDKYDDYGADFGPNYPQKRHYTDSNKVFSEEADKLSRELVEIKEELKKTQDKEKEIKKKLAKLIPSYHWVDVDNEWIVANECYRQPTRFNRTKVLCFLKNKFNAKVSNAVASKFKPSKAGYQTIFVKKNNLAKMKK
jgi:ribosomal protein L17